MTHQTPQEPREINVFERKDAEEITVQEIKALSSSDLVPGTVKQRTITEGYILVQGTAANRPTTPGKDSHFFFWFATDTNVLSVFNEVSEAWVSTTLS